MHYLFHRLSKVEKIFFTNHAKKRLVQRFKMFLTKYEVERPELFLEKDFKESVVNMADFLSPGYMNQIQTLHGKNSFIARSKNIIYFCVYDEDRDRIVIKTLVKNTGVYTYI